MVKPDLLWLQVRDSMQVFPTSGLNAWDGLPFSFGVFPTLNE